MLSKLLIIWSCLFCYANGSVGRDSSFQEMCEFYGATNVYYRTSDAEMFGDKCTFHIPHATDTEVSARRYCEENVPFHINKAIPGDITQCMAEATLICDSEWTQMFGKCYKIEKKVMTRDAAVKHCEAEGAGINGIDAKPQIAFMHRHALPFRVYDYFTGITRVWMDASETMTTDLIYDTPGGHILLALEGYRYHLPNIAFARVATTETASALCEYTPPMNQAESNYLLRRYGEIYYPALFTEHAAFIRTASSLNRNEDNKQSDNEYCNKVLKPFIPGGKARSAIPTRDFLNELGKMKVGGIVRTSAISSNANKDHRKQKYCKTYPKSVFQTFIDKVDGRDIPHEVEDPEWRPNQPDETCDAATYSTGIVLSRDGAMGLETMSDARYGPIYCQSIVARFNYTVCPVGYHMYERKHLGQKWCHKYVDEPKLNYTEAQAKCGEEGAYLSGYADQPEVAFMNTLFEAGSSALKQRKWDEALIGAHRKSTCERFGNTSTPGYVDKKGDDCSRELVFKWENKVAPNPPDFATNWATSREPNHGEKEEKCLVLLTGIDPNYDGIKNLNVTTKLNDHICHYSFSYFCGREAPIVEV